MFGALHSPGFGEPPQGTFRNIGARRASLPLPIGMYRPLLWGISA